MRCPACGSTVPPSEITAGLAHCPACDHIWEAAGAAAPVAKRPAGEISIGSPPEGVRVKVHRGNVLELSLPWRHQLGPLEYALFAGGLLALLGQFASTLNPVGLVFCGAILALAAYLGLNTTTVLIGAKGVDITHGPLPSPFDADIKMGAIMAAGAHVVEEHSYRRGRHRQTYHSLQAGGRTLLRRWSRRNKPEYVQACIQAIVQPPGGPIGHGKPMLPPMHPGV